MPNPLKVISVVEKNKLASDTPYIVLMKVDLTDSATGAIVESLYFANYPDNVTWGGVTWQMSQFSIELSHSAGEMPQITLSALDYARALIKPINDYNGGVGMPVTISVILNGDTSGVPELREYFQVLDCQISNYSVQFNLGAENGLNKQFPKRVQRRDFCNWVYKDPNTCQYAGTNPYCDRTLHGNNGCAAHQNAINFGGFPSISGQAATV